MRKLIPFALIIVGVLAVGYTLFWNESRKAAEQEANKVAAVRGQLATAPGGELGENPAGSGSVGNEMLVALPQKRRAAILGAIIVGADEQCVATRTFYMGTWGQDRSAYWSVGCTNGRAYVVEIQADAVGSTKVLDCSMLKFTTGVDCFKRFAR